MRRGRCGDKDRNYKIILFDGEKTFGKIQHFFMINFLESLGIQRIYLSRIRAVYSKPKPNSNMNWRKLQSISAKNIDKSRLATLPDSCSKIAYEVFL